MKTESKDFREVQKALSLKRHEQPPPKFFRSFSDEVIDRINTPHTASRLPWHERLGFGEDWKPALLILLGLAVCMVLAVGVAAALKVPRQSEALTSPQNDPAAHVYSNSETANALPPGFAPLPGTEETSDGISPVIKQSSPALSVWPVTNVDSGTPAPPSFK